jgi:hypothetical protein
MIGKSPRTQNTVLLGERDLYLIGFSVELRHCRMLRLTTRASVIDDYGPCGSLSDLAQVPVARAPNPAAIPAEVHTGPSAIKMRSMSTRTFGKRCCSS